MVTIAAQIIPLSSLEALFGAVFNISRMIWFTIVPVCVCQIGTIDPLVSFIRTVQVVEPNPDGRQPEGGPCFRDKIIFIRAVN